MTNGDWQWKEKSGCVLVFSIWRLQSVDCHDNRSIVMSIVMTIDLRR